VPYAIDRKKLATMGRTVPIADPAGGRRIPLSYPERVERYDTTSYVFQGRGGGIGST
jgi:hypothetical protein